MYKKTELALDRKHRKASVLSISELIRYRNMHGCIEPQQLYQQKENR